MKNEWAKRIIIAVMLVCFALMLYLCEDGRTITQLEAEVEYPRQNDTLQIEQLDIGIVRVDGEGKLYGTDMHAMLAGEGLSVNTITDIIIGDGITEMGYDVICDYPSLHTVRIGDNVKVMGNGSIRECDEMWFVYLPSGIERVSRDFLYDCNNCTVVTDGPAEDLPRLRNTKKANLIGNVDSFEAMQAAWTGETELPEMLEHWWE